jgi:hypothetical protein
VPPLAAPGHDLPSWPIAPDDRLGVELSRSRSEWAPPRRAEIAADFCTWGEGGYGKTQAAPFMSSRLFKWPVRGGARRRHLRPQNVYKLDVPVLGMVENISYFMWSTGKPMDHTTTSKATHRRPEIT